MIHSRVEEREQMVREQLQAKTICNARVLEAFRQVPRHLFVPEERQNEAYEDHPITIGRGQTISQPYMVATMSESLLLEGGERVLEIGTGSGYQTAILCALGARVLSMERHEDLLHAARNRVEELGYRDVQYRVGDGTEGWPEEAPFDRIIVTAGAPSIPKSLLEQIHDRGILLIPVGDAKQQELLRIHRKGKSLEQERICSCVFVKLVGREGWTV